MKYLLLIINREEDWERLPPSEREVVIGRMNSFGDELKSKGALVSCGGLAPSADAQCVQLTKKGRVVVPGVISRSRENEVATGFFVIQAATMDEAAEWAKKMPIIAGSIEIRPIAME